LDGRDKKYEKKNGKKKYQKRGNENRKKIFQKKLKLINSELK